MVTAQGKLSQVLLYAVIVGFVLGLVYDLVRIRRLLSDSREPVCRTPVFKKRIECILVFAEDILFAFICSVVLCIFIYYANSGRFRGVIPLGTVIGFVFYRRTLGKIVRPLLFRIARMLVSVIRRLYNIAVLPLYRCFSALCLITVGWVFRSVSTAVLKRKSLGKAESGFGIISNKGKKNNEKEFEYIFESRRGGHNTVLYGNHNKNAI